ncbi:hypothetical protein KKH07_01510 [Patescibacteria group bacterium]|nr:hypothetical protein [Patescibacteria group bacterium]MBU1563908.1 hypothetical protein [Patescibacteria group bacterium]
MKKIIILLLVSFVFLGIANFALAQEDKVKLYFFYGDGCSNCAKAEKFLAQMEDKYPQLEIISYEVFNNKENAKLFLEFLEACNEEKIVRVPIIFIGQEVIKGYLNDQTAGALIEKAIQECTDNQCLDPLNKVDECKLCQCQGEKGESCDCQTCTCPIEKHQDEIIQYPFIGEINLSKLSLPVLTVIVAALDGFNPCAMWVLLFLLALLINVQSRKRIWLIAGTFIFTSGIIYYLLLAAWLNIFLAISYVGLTRIIIGSAAIIFGLWQLRKFIIFKPGVCEIAPDGSKIKTKIQTQTEKVVNSPILFVSVIGVIVLALAVNLIEFFCSAGLPAIYTSILSLSKLSSLNYYLYLLLYTIIFMLDDVIIFVIALITLNKIGFTDKYTKWSLLIGGSLIFILGLLLIFKPDFLVFG